MIPKSETMSKRAAGSRISQTTHPNRFTFGPAGEFGVDGDRWVPLHASVEGLIDELPLSAFEPVIEIRGLADTWWRGSDSLIAIYTGGRILGRKGFASPACTPVSTNGD